MSLSGIWKKSRRSGPQGGNCVEIRHTENNNIQIRDSKHPNGPVLTFNPAKWDPFLNCVKAGEFDL